MSRYIHELPKWPAFSWETDRVLVTLASVRHRQGLLLGKLAGLGFELRIEASLETITQDIMKTSEIEGEKLSIDEVRSSVAKRLGIERPGMITARRDVEGIVEMMMDATQHFDKVLTEERLRGWHAALFPTGYSGLHKIQAGQWRTDAEGPMQVASGAMGKEYVHYEAPAATRLPAEIKSFLIWFNTTANMDPVLKSAVAHLWFITLHPLDDGNGRIARAIADMQLARADGTRQRFYSMSAQIQRERKAYYDVLEKTQKGDLDITEWLMWYFECLDRAILLSEENLAGVISKARFWETHQHALLNARQRKMLNALMDGFEGKLTTTKWAKMTNSSTDTALRDIQDLITKQILIKEESGGRSTAYRINNK